MTEMMKENNSLAIYACRLVGWQEFSKNNILLPMLKVVQYCLQANLTTGKVKEE